MLKLVKGRLHLNLSHRQLHAKIMLKIVKSTNMFKIDDFSQLYQLIQRVQLLDFFECFKLLAPLNLPSTKGLSVAFSVLEHISEREIQIFFVAINFQATIKLTLLLSLELLSFLLKLARVKYQ